MCVQQFSHALMLRGLGAAPPPSFEIEIPRPRAELVVRGTGALGESPKLAAVSAPRRGPALDLPTPASATRAGRRSAENKRTTSSNPPKRKEKKASSLDEQEQHRYTATGSTRRRRIRRATGRGAPTSSAWASVSGSEPAVASDPAPPQRILRQPFLDFVMGGSGGSLAPSSPPAAGASGTPLRR